MKTTDILLIIASILTAFSCGRSYKLNSEDFRYIPYEKQEILVFQSDRNDMDTIFIKGHWKYNGCNDPLAIFPDKCEGYSLKCTKTDPNYDRYLDEKGLVSIVASSKGKTYISFDITLKRSWFYGLESFSLKEFDSIPTSKLTIGNKKYDDVKIFEASDYAKQYEYRENYAERFYWSVNDGFLGLDRKEEKWRLIKKYVP